MIASSIDAFRVHRHFERAADRYAAASALQQEVGRRLLERLEFVRLTPLRVIDAGAGSGGITARLAQRYPGAQVVALDASLGMLRQGWPRRGALARLLRQRIPGAPVCAEMERLPFPDESAELLCSNLALHWSSAPEQALREMHRVLGRGGLLMFTTLGPDTLKELRAALPASPASVHAFADMHDVGDLLVRTGFAGPVMDMERIVLTYPDVKRLLQDLRDSGASSARTDLPRGLRTRAWLAALEQRYEAQRRDGTLPATFEIVYGHAWKPDQPPRTNADGRAIVQFHPRRSTPSR
jgi:malonyl-CoA O-methyltransferase